MGEEFICFFLGGNVKSLTCGIFLRFPFVVTHFQIIFILKLFIYWINAIKNPQSVFSIYNYWLSCVHLEHTINITLGLFSYVIDNGIIFLHHVFWIWAVMALHNFVSFYYSKWLNPFSSLFNLLNRILAVSLILLHSFFHVSVRFFTSSFLIEY